MNERCRLLERLEQLVCGLRPKLVRSFDYENATIGLEGRHVRRCYHGSVYIAYKDLVGAAGSDPCEVGMGSGGDPGARPHDIPRSGG